MPLPIDIWSDIACPWCYVGKRKLEAALATFDHRDDVQIRWHAFELDPAAPAEVDREVPYAERLARKYQTTVESAEAMMDRMARTASDDGIEMRFDTLRAGNTFDAHRVIAFAAEHDLQDAVKERILKAYFTEGELVSDHGALARFAGEAGLDAGEVSEMLASDAYAAEVRLDEAHAARLGIHGVPFFVFGGRFGVSGAQPVETLGQILDRAWEETQLPEEVIADGAVCGPDGC